MNTGMQFTKPQPASRICSTYHLVACSEPTGQVGDDDVGARLLEHLHDVGGGAGRLDDLLREVAVPRPSWVMPRMTLTPSLGTSAPAAACCSGPAKIASERSLPTLSASMSKAAVELDVAHVVAAEVDVHEARAPARSGRRPCRTARPARTRTAQLPTPMMATRTFSSWWRAMPLRGAVAAVGRAHSAHFLLGRRPREHHPRAPAVTQDLRSVQRRLSCLRTCTIRCRIVKADRPAARRPRA